MITAIVMNAGSGNPNGRSTRGSREVRVSAGIFCSRGDAIAGAIGGPRSAAEELQTSTVIRA